MPVGIGLLECSDLAGLFVATKGSHSRFSFFRGLADELRAREEADKRAAEKEFLEKMRK